MAPKANLILVLLLACTQCYSQKSILLEGSDSIRISVYKQNSKIFVVEKESLTSETSTETSIIFSSEKVLAKLMSFVKLPELQKQINDSAGKYLRGNDTVIFTILNRKAIAPADGPEQSRTDKIIPTVPGNSGKVEKTGTTMLLPVALGVLTAANVAFWIFFIRKRSRKRFEEMHSVEGEEMKVSLPQVLLETFPAAAKQKHITAAASLIIEEFQEKRRQLKDAGEQLNISQSTASELRGGIVQLENQLQAQKNEVSTKNSEVAALRSLLAEQENNKVEFHRLAQTIIAKYFTDLNTKLRDNESLNKEEINQLILRNIFSFAFHGISILKREIQQASDLDDLNVDLLNGKEVTPTNTITDSSTFGTSSLLPYYTYQLLKSHGIKKLDGVLILGNKIGA